MSKVLAIDPGLDGALVYLDNSIPAAYHFIGLIMPVIENGKNREIDFDGLISALKEFKNIPIFLERAVAFSMGTTGAFNYGRGFANIEIAIKLSNNPVVYVEPTKWTKVMHSGISSDLKSKIKSGIAVKRLFPRIIKTIPKNRNGKLHDGIVDALLLAGYGLKNL